MKWDTGDKMKRKKPEKCLGLWMLEENYRIQSKEDRGTAAARCCSDRMANNTLTDRAKCANLSRRVRGTTAPTAGCFHPHKASSRLQTIQRSNRKKKIPKRLQRLLQGHTSRTHVQGNESNVIRRPNRVHSSLSLFISCQCI